MSATVEYFRPKQQVETLLVELSAQIKDVLSNDGLIGICDASWINTGRASYCAALMDTHVRIQEQSHVLDDVKSNNDAEYEALTSLVNMAIQSNQTCLLFSDSLTQIEKFKRTCHLPERISLRWIPRKMVGPANAHARNALGLSWNKHAKNWGVWLSHFKNI